MHLSASEKIAAFAVGFDASAISAEARAAAARALYDTIAVAVGGAHEPASARVLDYARGQGTNAARMATVWATGERLPVEMAALVNGTMGHVLDFDDVSSPLRGHPSVAMFPAVVALGEGLGSAGRAVLDACVVGLEVTVRIARAIVDDQYAKGWHSTVSIAAFGTTAACARLLGLDQQRTIHALGILVSQIAGTRENFGTMGKAFQAGQANAIALRSVLLADAGLDASPAALDGKQGYAVLYADGQDLHAELDRLGELPLEIERSGLDIKKYPLCYATHRAIQGMLDIRRETPFTLDDVERVDVKTNYRATVPLIHDRPRTGLEAKFSMQYAMAAAICDGAVNLASFRDEPVLRPEIQAFFDRVHLSQGEPPTFPRWAEVAVHLRDGRRLAIRVEALRGSAQLPLTDDELIEKATDCFVYGRKAPGDAGRLGQACFHLERLPLQAVLDSLRGWGRRASPMESLAAPHAPR
ncbi:MmgE/PrpD family protein [Cupriavidus sp. WS]|uniref:MmgE/PrpD family protein n=1 Tax=Cupriavidus sp. WS TaxID=1312922 RepID=UPI00037DFF7B|nr:MmgE/PrpD family protein [Cupriavidus sp. WS]